MNRRAWNWWSIPGCLFTEKPLSAFLRNVCWHYAASGLVEYTESGRDGLLIESVSRILNLVHDLVKQFPFVGGQGRFHADVVVDGGEVWAQL